MTAEHLGRTSRANLAGPRSPSPRRTGMVLAALTTSLLVVLLAVGDVGAAAEEPSTSPPEAPQTASLPVPREPDRCDIEGTTGDDRLRATERGQIICGLGGNDVLIGTTGHDILRGGPGRDELRAGDGDDDLYGGESHDVCRQADGDGFLEYCEKPIAGIAVTVALEQVGDEYQWAAEGPDEFDCSGLTWYAWKKAGVMLNRSSNDQYRGLERVGRAQLQPGDLVFFYSPISHVAMYIGNGMLVHAVNEQSGVRIDPLAGYYAQHFNRAARPA